MPCRKWILRYNTGQEKNPGPHAWVKWKWKFDGSYYSWLWINNLGCHKKQFEDFPLKLTLSLSVFLSLSLNSMHAFMHNMMNELF